MSSKVNKRNMQASKQLNTIMYLCYGSGHHSNETVFSLLTAFKHLPPDSEGYQYLVYTDKPELFAGMNINVRLLSNKDLSDWMGGRDYIHRRKTMSIIDALRNNPGKLVFVDCDTFFRRSPALLFDRIGPGRSVLHVLEAKLLQSGTEIDKELSDLFQKEQFFDRNGRNIVFSRNADMWNSGVIGLHSSDIGLLEQAPDLIDQIWDKSRVHHVEQFVTGYLLAENSLSECTDIVFHYWADYIRKPFHKRLPEILSRQARSALPVRAAGAYSARPRPSFSRWIKVNVRATFRRLGLPISGIMKSA